MESIFVAPQGLSGGWGNGNNSDVIFTDDMYKLITDDLCVDTSRVFAMGFSWGGGMSKALGCQRQQALLLSQTFALMPRPSTDRKLSKIRSLAVSSCSEDSSPAFRAALR